MASDAKDVNGLTIEESSNPFDVWLKNFDLFEYKGVLEKNRFGSQKRIKNFGPLAEWLKWVDTDVKPMPGHRCKFKLAFESLNPDYSQSGSNRSKIWKMDKNKAEEASYSFGVWLKKFDLFEYKEVLEQNGFKSEEHIKHYGTLAEWLQWVVKDVKPFPGDRGLFRLAFESLNPPQEKEEEEKGGSQKLSKNEIMFHFNRVNSKEEWVWNVNGDGYKMLESNVIRNFVHKEPRAAFKSVHVWTHDHSPIKLSQVEGGQNYFIQFMYDADLDPWSHFHESREVSNESYASSIASGLISSPSSPGFQEMQNDKKKKSMKKKKIEKSGKKASNEISGKNDKNDKNDKSGKNKHNENETNQSKNDKNEENIDTNEEKKDESKIDGKSVDEFLGVTYLCRGYNVSYNSKELEKIMDEVKTNAFLKESDLREAFKEKRYPCLITGQKDDVIMAHICPKKPSSFAKAIKVFRKRRVWDSTKRFISPHDLRNVLPLSSALEHEFDCLLFTFIYDELSQVWSVYAPIADVDGQDVEAYKIWLKISSDIKTQTECQNRITQYIEKNDIFRRCLVGHTLSMIKKHRLSEEILENYCPSFSGNADFSKVSKLDNDSSIDIDNKSNMIDDDKDKFDSGLIEAIGKIFKDNKDFLDICGNNGVKRLTGEQKEKLLSISNQLNFAKSMIHKKRILDKQVDVRIGGVNKLAARLRVK